MAARSPLTAPDERALAIWGAATTAYGTPVERHLRDYRGISIDIPPTIRLGCGPSMIAAVQDPQGWVIAVQAMQLTSWGEKATIVKPRHTIGALGSGAVRIGSATTVLGLAEGTEKALAAKELTGIDACWCSLRAHRMHRIAVPEFVRELHLFADADDAGRAAVERTAYEHRHRRVVIHFPPSGFKDWDEITQRRAGGRRHG